MTRTLHQLIEASTTPVASHLLEASGSGEALLRGVSKALIPVLKRISSEPHDIRPESFTFMDGTIEVEYAANFPSFDPTEVGKAFETSPPSEEVFDSYRKSFNEALAKAVAEARRSIPPALKRFEDRIYSIDYMPNKSVDICISAARKYAAERAAGRKSMVDITSALLRVIIAIQ